MEKKLGRNDPCWCGSGIKYKKCHMDREKQMPVNTWEADRELKKLFSARYCLAPDPMKIECSSDIVKAHSIPKSGSLQRIARDGHVYSYRPSVEKINKYQGKLPPELVGINRASTFTGFCSKHDDAIFTRIEKQVFDGSHEQCFLLGYRALAREIYTKKLLVATSEILGQSDQGKSLEQQHYIQELKYFMDIGASAGLRDCKYYKTVYDKMLLSNDFSDIRAYIIELSFPPPIMCSAGTFPEQDFEGNELQDLTNLKVIPHLLNFTSFYGGDYGTIVFSWLPECDSTCMSFINSLRSIPSDKMTNSLIRFFFEFCENLHIQPEWWERLEAEVRSVLIDKMATAARPDLKRKAGCLVDDGIVFDNWQISDLRAINF